jgi:uroporphyrinogen III methyltransferase / synthase
MDREMVSQGSPGGDRSKPLLNRRVVVTRPRAQSAEFIEELERLGADVIAFPTIRITDPEDSEPLRAAVREVGSFHWIVFTSVNGVDRFWGELRAAGLGSDSLADVSLCAIGPATAAAIEEEGARAELIPDEFVAEAVVEALLRHGSLEGARILLPRAAEARSVLPDSLREHGAYVLEVAAYRTVPDLEGSEQVRRLLRTNEVDLITFTASSTVRNFVESVGTEIGSARVASIGPITSGTARNAGLPVQVEASEYTIPGLTSAIVRYYVGEER